MRYNRPRELWQVIVADILVGALALGLVVFFQLGLPILQAKARSRARQAEREQQTQTEQVVSPAQAQADTQTAPAAEPGIAAPEAPADATPVPEGGIVGDLTGTTPTPVPTEDPRTEWQIRFAEHFTDEVVITDHSYTSPQVSITIETREFDAGNGKSVYHVADIYVASLDNFRTYTANNELEFWSTQDAMEMDADSHAILTISGDFYSYQPKGFLVRNGELYMSDQTYCDLCVLYDSGVMACYGRDEYTVEDVWNRGVAQAWNFGPSLLDENGHVKPDYELSEAVSFPNPRSAVGYYEPGHYCFVTIDGRKTGYSNGLTLHEEAQLMESLGCKVAFNLDGGQTSQMCVDGVLYNDQSGNRSATDIVYIPAE